MSIIRTDEQADAQEILKLIIETTDFYRAMGEILTEENIHHQLLKLPMKGRLYRAVSKISQRAGRIS